MQCFQFNVLCIYYRVKLSFGLFEQSTKAAGCSQKNTSLISHLLASDSPLPEYMMKCSVYCSSSKTT